MRLETFEQQERRVEYDPRELCEALLRISSVEVEELKGRVRTADGVVRSIVHPLYTEYAAHDHEAAEWQREGYREVLENEKVGRIKNYLFRVANKSGEGAPPIFVWEEKKNISETMRRLMVQGLDNKAYFVPTVSGTSRPAYPEQYIKSSDYLSAWTNIATMFDYLGVEKVILSGTYLCVHKEEGRESLGPGGCVGQLAQALKGKIKVDISPATYPQSRSDFKGW